MKEFFTTKEAAKFLGVHKSTLDHWRIQDKGPKCHKSKDGIIRYRLRDLLEYMGAAA